MRWIVVADSPFLPARGGGEREHAGLVAAMAAAGTLALLIVPALPGLDLDPYRDLVGDVPILPTPLLRWPLHLLQPSRTPYAVASRPGDVDLANDAQLLAPDATAVLLSSWKSRQLGEVLSRRLSLPVVLRMHNREGDYHRALAAGASGVRRWVMRREAGRVGRDEHSLGRAPWLTAMADISAADARDRQRQSSVPVAHVPPFAIRPRPSTLVRAPAERPTVLFVGALDVSTNADALTWFTSLVWPHVLARVPSCEFRVVGRAPTPAVRARLNATPGTVLFADVPDVEPHLAAAHVSVNPAVSGSGVNIKVVEALAAGVPVVSTSRATAGLDLCDGRDLLVADDPAEFADAIVTLLRAPVRAAGIGASGQRRIAELTDVTRSLDQLARLALTRGGRRHAHESFNESEPPAQMHRGERGGQRDRTRPFNKATATRT